jgi:hypothetical protein
VNEITAEGMTDYEDRCACGREYRQKPTDSCDDGWHKKCYEQYLAQNRIRKNRNNALIRAEKRHRDTVRPS